MAQLASLEFTIQDASGNAVSGASVEVRRQGAQVSGSGSGTSITVDSPGAVIAADVVVLNATSSPTRTVSSITATTVVVGGAGFSSWSDDDRVSIVSALPTIYEDAEAATSKSNPLTTDANGYASCFVIGGKYDALVSGGGLTTRLLQDVAAVGGETSRSNVYMSGSDTAWTLDTLRAAAAGDKLLSVQTAGSEKFSVRGDGEIVAGAAGATHALTGSLSTTTSISAGTSVAATTTVSAGTSVAATTTVTAGTGLVATTGGVTATGNSTITGSLGGITGLTCQAIYHTIPTLTVNSTTPTVSAGTVFAENNSNPTSITDFTPHNDGQEISIIINTTNTTFVDGATLQMAGGVNFNPNGNDVVTFVQWGGTWYEKCRSAN